MAAVVERITSTIPTSSSTTAGTTASGGTWPSQTAAISVDPGISSRIARDTTVAEVVASTRFTTV